MSSIIAVFACYEDLGDDRNTVKGKLLGVCRTKADANKLAKGHGWYGGSGIIESMKALVLDLSDPPSVREMFLLAHSKSIKFVDMKEQQKAGKLDGFNKALAKLDDDDLKELGLGHLRKKRKKRKDA